MTLYLGEKKITNREELEEGMANIPEGELVTTLDRDETIQSLKELVAALSASSQPHSLAEVDMPAGVLIWDFISVAGLGDFAEEILGTDLYGKIIAQVEIEEDETNQ